MARRASRDSGHDDRHSGARCPSAARRGERLRSEHHYQFAPDFRRRLEAIVRTGEPRRCNLAADSGFETMDFPTRTLYRSAIEDLSRGSNRAELDIARAAVLATKQAEAEAPAMERERRGDTGYILLGGGRRAFEKSVAYRRPARSWASRVNRSVGVGGYVTGFLLSPQSFLRRRCSPLVQPELAWPFLACLACSAPFPRSTPPWRWSIAGSTSASPRRCSRLWSYSTGYPHICARSSPCQRCSLRWKASRT